MALRVNTNIAALNAYRNLSVTDGQMSKSLEKLSSGFRINRAADDAAGLAISEGLRSQIGGLKVAVRNTQDGISVVQTAEGALTETHSILQRMRDLSVQAANDGGLNDDAKANIQSEIGQLKDELTRIAETTNFNGKNLLDGSFSASFQVGANAGESISVAIGSANKGMDAAGLGVDAIDVEAATGGTVASGITAGSAAVAASNGPDGVVGGGDDVAAVAATPAEATLTAVTGAETFNGKLTIGANTVDLSAYSTTMDATAVAELETALGLTAGDITFTAGTDTTAATIEISTAATATAPSFDGLSGAEAAIGALDQAIKTVSNTRADLGAVQNRFDHTINNLNVSVENLTASESRIRDADMAQEMVGFTRNQILSQAGTAMLAQANQASQGVLSLLR
jgi:flagellin